LGQAASVAAEAAMRDVSTEQVIEERRGMTRREVIAGGTGLALAAALSGPLPRALAASDAPRVVVVGAGLAGLSCAYQLKQAGIRADVYEASDRVGGRCWTLRDYFAKDQIAEHGGELIDQGHTAIRQLAQSLGLKLDNLLAAEVNGTEPLYYFDEEPYTFAEATNDIKQIWQQLHKDVSAASYPTLYNNSTPRGRELDKMSIEAWIRKYVPGVPDGMSSKLGQLLYVAYTIEYGGEASEQSSLNMLYLLAYSGQGQLRIFGPSNEKYHVRGGNDQIATGLADALQDEHNELIHFDMPMSSIERNAQGKYILGFRDESTTETADRVVLALPFSILRELDYSNAGFSEGKTIAIEELGMGTNSKLHLQFHDRYWYEFENNGETFKNNGETFADTGYQNTWEVTRAQGGAPGILVDYTGGDVGASFGPENGSATERAQQFLEQIDPVIPGLGDHWIDDKATIDYWTGYEWTKGSYSFWKVEQYTRFAGREREIEGACHFCGEHTSIDFQGYLNGAVETGYRAAAEVIDALGEAG
jgi:monoamine oxidase